MAQPFFNMVAGPNGSGKTTLTDSLRRNRVDLGDYINADEIALALREVIPSERAKLAQAHALSAVASNIRDGRSSTFETVMSHSSKIDILRVAKSAGFTVRLYFVGTSDPVINLTRVIARVAQGGHDVPVEKIKSRYDRSMRFLIDAARSVDEGVIFDNSIGAVFNNTSDKPLQMVGSFSRQAEKIAWKQRSISIPEWA